MTERSENEALWEKLRQAWWENRTLEEQVQRLQTQLQKSVERERAEISRVEEKLRMPVGKARGCAVQCSVHITRYRTHDVRQCSVVAFPTRTATGPYKPFQVAKEDTWEKAQAVVEKWLTQDTVEKKELSERPKEPSQEELEPLCFHVQR